MRFRPFFATIFFPLIVTSLFGCKREELKRDSTGPGLWEITVGENKSYLFGSIHVGSDDLYPLPQAVEEAFAKSKTFVIEANLASISQLHLMTFLECNGIYPDGDRLENHL